MFYLNAILSVLFAAVVYAGAGDRFGDPSIVPGVPPSVVRSASLLAALIATGLILSPSYPALGLPSAVGMWVFFSFALFIHNEEPSITGTPEFLYYCGAVVVGISHLFQSIY
jgi:hypothetical protein